ncbi:Phenol 2-monooxygenase [Pleurostoma richardsiae]|uniref:Phenol 2-monooxygenase n=1 Tax=Pleurostoma richardsiae TaxID=41990 RepID=A0AA38S3P5_9PEZI|nr:Phenol 2-monooxygenase [Pleurostoma richardsiae]
MATPVVVTDFLIIGAGPAGASLGCFLGQNGLKGIIVSNAPGTAETPRAHVVNPSGVECLRDIGLEEEARNCGIQGEEFRSMRWCRSMVGEEYGKVYAWGGHPDSKRDAARATPCEWMDLPQTYLEPILVKYASHHGFAVRFSNELVSVKRNDAGTVVATMRDLITKTNYQIHTRYIFGADGGRSQVARQMGFNFNVAPSSGVACNILLKADLNHLMHGRHSQLHWIMNPESMTRFGIAPCLRMVRPWTEWLVVAFTPGATEDTFKDLTPESPELINFIREMIGDETVGVKVERLDPWVVRETVAEKFSSKRNVFILGDAAHRHPPAYGLGSNTCIQDAYNLAWKIAYVEKGLAGPSLLDSYNDERQPVGASLVRQSNECMDAHARVWEALGMFAPSTEEGGAYIKELEEPTERGASRRQQLHEALEGKRREGESLGLTMNQWYASKAIYLNDETGPRPQPDGDAVVKVLISTYPGNRLPHAWLDRPTRGKMISTHDLAGKGAFCLLTGHGGDKWKRAVEMVAASTGILIRAYGIGAGLDYHDVYRDWRVKREVREDGCVLVRPDRFVAWRSMTMVSDCNEKLLQVFSRILARDELNHQAPLVSLTSSE